MSIRLTAPAPRDASNQHNTRLRGNQYEWLHHAYSLGCRLTLGLALHIEGLVVFARLLRHLEQQLVGGRLFEDQRR